MLEAPIKTNFAALHRRILKATPPDRPRDRGRPEVVGSAAANQRQETRNATAEGRARPQDGSDPLAGNGNLLLKPCVSLVGLAPSAPDPVGRALPLRGGEAELR